MGRTKETSGQTSINEPKTEDIQENVEEGWERISPNVWKPEGAGDFIEGVLVDKRKTGDFDSESYSIETKEGFKLVWGTTILSNRMKLINVGDHIRIIYKGTETNKKGQPLKIYEVLRKKTEE